MKEVDVEVQQNSEEVQQEEVEKVEDDVLEDVVTEETEVQITDEDEKESAKRLETLEEKRSIVNNDADKHRKLRDEYHAMTKEWKSKRDALNSQVRELVTDAGKCRDERDQFNTLVREAKAQRDEWNVKVSELKRKLTELRPEKPEDKEKSGPSLEEMKRNLRRMELEQQTGVLTKAADDKLVKLISQLAKQIDERESEMESSTEHNAEYREIQTMFREAKATAESFHTEMSKNADLAQSAHERMIALYDQADRLRKEADAAQAKLVEYKRLGDEEHRMHIELVRSIQDTDREASGIRNRKSNARKKKVEADNKKEAKEIFERFKNGDKLSTEDLMALQRSGYL